MPELPEVETVRRAMAQSLQGDVIDSVTLYREGLRTPFAPDFADRLRGRTVMDVRRRAKYLVVDLNGPDLLILHLGMSGRVLLQPPGQHALIGKHDHIAMQMRDGIQLLFHDPRRFGMAFVIAKTAFDAHPAFASLGPEPLGNDFSAPALAAALDGRKTSIKVALLDQHVVAGVGNIYACEALYYAGISPLRLAGDLRAEELERLVPAIRQVLESAIAAGGSSLRDYRHTDGDLGYFQQKLAVYDKEGKPCQRCGDTVLRISQGGRSTFYCPACQR